jgi:transcriptional regulator with XRE-family HTH domain
MEPVFSPSKILAQVKVLPPVDGHRFLTGQKSPMAKAAQKKQIEPRGDRPLQRTFIEQWRRHLGWNQTQLGRYLGVSTSTVSQIENAETGYKQEYLEGIAEAVGCDPADLLVRAPDDPRAIWSLWDRASKAQREQIVRVAAALLDTR